MQTKDFVTAFRPKDGDLIYGRAEARGAYFAQFTPSQVKACNDYAAWVTIDQYNDYFGTSGDAIVAGPNIAKIRQYVAGKDPMTSVQDTLQKKPDLGFKQFDQREAYQSQVMKSRYAPTSVRDPVQGSAHKLASEGFAAGTAVTPTADDALLQNMAYKSIRRACKFGIGLVAIDAAFRAPRAKIRFVLDGLDMEAVAGKHTRQGYDRIAVPITSSELRYVCRNWAKLKDFVKFYVNLSAVKPPWEEDWDLPSIAAPGIPPQTRARKDAWDAYAGARTQKYAGAPPAKSLI